MTKFASQPAGTVWLAVPAGWLANFVISYVALRKSWPKDTLA